MNRLGMAETGRKPFSASAAWPVKFTEPPPKPPCTPPCISNIAILVSKRGKISSNFRILLVYEFLILSYN
jgi:hypothetical protein